MSEHGTPEEVSKRVESIIREGVESHRLANERGQEEEEDPAERERLLNACAEIVSWCDDHQMSYQQPIELLKGKELDVQRLRARDDYREEDWYLASIGSDRSKVRYVVPEMRRAMGRIPLNDYFKFAGYNGLNPLGSENVKRFARMNQQGQLIEPGLIENQRG